TRVTVRTTRTLEMVALDGARETLADGDTGYIDLLAFGEDGLNLDLGTGLELGKLGRIEPELVEHAGGFDARLGVVTDLRLVHARGAPLTEGQLHRGIAVGFGRLHLSHTVARHVQHGYRD